MKENQEEINVVSLDDLTNFDKLQKQYTFPNQWACTIFYHFFIFLQDTPKANNYSSITCDHMLWLLQNILWKIPKYIIGKNGGEGHCKGNLRSEVKGGKGDQHNTILFDCGRTSNQMCN